MSLLVPTVIEQTAKGERAFDIWSRLLNQRLIFFGTQLDDTVANLIIAQLLHLEAEDPGKDIRLYINSPGGDMTALFAIYDTMQLLRCDVATFCIGQAASAAAVILAGGTKGKRFALPNSRVLIHQPHGGAQGQATDIEIQAMEVLRLRQRLNEILAYHCKIDVEQVLRDTDRDKFMDADTAKRYGLVDEVLARPSDPSKKNPVITKGA